MQKRWSIAWISRDKADRIGPVDHLMAKLSWSGVCSCFEALRVPRWPADARDELARIGHVKARTAGKYLRTCKRLGLVWVVADGSLVLAGRPKTPDALLLESTLIRFFRRWQQIEPRTARVILDGTVSLRQLGILGVGLLQTADALARHIPSVPGDLPPDAGLLLELSRLWSEAHSASREPPLWSATEAFGLFQSILHASTPPLSPEITSSRFVRACASLYNRRLVRLGIVQHAIERDEPYGPFRTEIGHIKSIFSPKPFEEHRHAQPVQEIRRRVSSGR